MGNSQSTTQQVQYCLYQKQDFNTMMDILADTKIVTDAIAEHIYNDHLPIVIQPFSKLTRNYFESLKNDPSKMVYLNGKYFTLCSISDDIYIYNRVNDKKYKIDDADKKEHLKEIFLKSKQIVKIILEILYKSCDGDSVPGVLNTNKTSLKNYSAFRPPPEPVQPTLITIPVPVAVTPSVSKSKTVPSVSESTVPNVSESVN